MNEHALKIAAALTARGVNYASCDDDGVNIADNVAIVVDEPSHRSQRGWWVVGKQRALDDFDALANDVLALRGG